VNVPRPTVRRLVVLATALPCLALPPALAVQEPVSTSRLGAVHLVLAGAGHAVHLDLRVHDRAGGDLVTVGRSVCDASGCAGGERFEAVLETDVAAIERDAAAGRARLVLGGRRLSITWEPDAHSGAVVGGLQGGGTTTEHVLSAYNGQPAVAQVDLDGQACAVDEASVGDGVRVAVPEGSAGAAAPLAELSLEGLGLACS
jgi:hypothetical protein